MHITKDAVGGCIAKSVVDIKLVLNLLDFHLLKFLETKSYIKLKCGLYCHNLH